MEHDDFLSCFVYMARAFHVYRVPKYVQLLGFPYGRLIFHPSGLLVVDASFPEAFKRVCKVGSLSVNSISLQSGELSSAASPSEDAIPNHPLTKTRSGRTLGNDAGHSTRVLSVQGLAKVPWTAYMAYPSHSGPALTVYFVLVRVLSPSNLSRCLYATSLPPQSSPSSILHFKRFAKHALTTPRRSSRARQSTTSSIKRKLKTDGIIFRIKS